jgi:DNA-binding transcriptional MerR regulator
MAISHRKKSAVAFRTISEASEELDVPQHVLRFWETKFTQIRPLKRGGRRRYYRPEDLDLLRTIRDLLYVQGYTIKGVQRLFKEGQVEEVLQQVGNAEAVEVKDAVPEPAPIEKLPEPVLLSQDADFAAMLAELRLIQTDLRQAFSL